MKHIYSYLLLLALVCSTACTKLDLANMDDMGYQTSLAIPVCRYQANILEILASQDTSGMITLDGNTIYITWQQNLKPDSFDIIDLSAGTPTADRIVLKDLPRFSFLENVTDTYRLGKTITYRDTIIYDFGFNTIEPNQEYIIDSILFTGAKLNLKLFLGGMVMDGDYIVFTCKLPGLRKCSSRSFSDTLRVANDTIRLQKDFTRCLADFTEIEEVGNGMKMILIFQFVGTGNMGLTRKANIYYEAEFKDLKYEEAHGKLWNAKPVCDSKFSLQVPPELYKMDIFQNNKLLFHNPTFDLHISHNVGARIRYKIDYMYSKDHFGEFHYADFHGNKSCTNILDRPKEPGDTTDETITFNRHHGSTNKLFEEIPDSLGLKYEVFVGEQDGKHIDFILASKKMNLNVKVSADMCFDPSKDFVREDTIEADLASADPSFLDYASIDSFFLYMTAHNHIPAHLGLYMVFLDSLDNPIYIVEDLHVECPEIYPNGTVKEETNENLPPVLFLGDDIRTIMNTKRIKFIVTIAGKDAESMTNIKADDYLHFEVSAFAKVKANLNNIFNK